ncbi:hypothetical protein [Streptomyces sp. NPDC005989]|uniref:hypothetical protein n=1 Tax=Streptomyces sp. NPDC005989 TaxID=3156727 RepID=UPI0033C53AD9
MPETTPNSKGPAPIQYTAEPAPIPAAEVKAEDVGTLSLRYVDGAPVVVVSGGTVIPAGLTVVDETGRPAAVYTASSLPANGTAIAGGSPRLSIDALNTETSDQYVAIRR